MPEVHLIIDPEPGPYSTLLFRFDKFYLPAINQLLNKEKGKKLALTIVGKEVMYGTIHPVERLTHLRSVGDLNGSLNRLKVRLNKSEKILSSLLKYLEKEINERNKLHEFGEAYSYYTTIQGELQRFAEKLNYFVSLPPPEQEQEEDSYAKPIYTELAEAIKNLIEVQDMPLRRERAKEKARERLGTKSTRVTPAKADWEAVEVEDFEASYKAREILNCFLREHDTNYRISLQGNLRRLAGEGNPPEPYFQNLFEPFIDYLCSEKPPFHLGVCDWCASIYMRTPGQTTKRFCNKHCERIARQYRSKNQHNPQRSPLSSLSILHKTPFQLALGKTNLLTSSYSPIALS